MAGYLVIGDEIAREVAHATRPLRVALRALAEEVAEYRRQLGDANCEAGEVEGEAMRDALEQEETR